MEDLKDAGWNIDENKTEEEINDIDMKAMFDNADQERRDSQDLVAFPRKVINFYCILNICNKKYRYTPSSKAVQWQR